MLSRNKDRYNISSGVCPDEKCQSKLFFPSFDSSIECTHCGQRHEKAALQDIQEVSDIDVAFRNVIRNIVVNDSVPKRGTEMVKVLGLSNYHCKLLSPLLTKYGMDKKTGKAKLLTEMNQGDIFDCGLFGDRAFLIEPEHISVPGFGRDISGSMNYLSETLASIKAFNNGEERLIPIHADGDGHCLVHAVSRALVGRELFWHPLRCSLKRHFEDNLQNYKELLKDFVDERDWEAIVDECDPDFLPPEGDLLGLRNIHVFGLANVLKRPIILLDSLECMQSLGDYAALFLPSLVSPDLCRGKDNRLNRPLCIAWSSLGHNHYIPLVGIKKMPLPELPQSLIPKVWGVPQNQIHQYMEFSTNGCCIIGGSRSLGDPYILRLVSAMEEVYFEQYGVHPTLVADVHHYVYHSRGIVGVQPQMVAQATKKAVEEGRLYRCLHCDAICEHMFALEWFQKGGILYTVTLHYHGTLTTDRVYNFPIHGVVCKYDPKKDELVPDMTSLTFEKCTWCQGESRNLEEIIENYCSHLRCDGTYDSCTIRKVKSDGTVAYKNKDKTKTPSVSSSCSCGFKHFWCGKEYDNLPQELNVTLDWNNKVARDSVIWFQNESDRTLNSNVYQVASEVVQKHFPGEFGSERLVQRVVDQLLEQTKQPEPNNKNIPIASSSTSNDNISPKKLIIGGKGVIHKEELGLSETERKIKQRIETHASLQQKRQIHAKEEEKGDIKSADVSGMVQRILRDTGIPATSTSLHPNIVPSKVKLVRVVTSDGRQAQLRLETDGITYEDLQTWIYNQFQIPPSSQRIKYGFPPQELHSPCIGEEGKTVALSHGDRVMVEMAPTMFTSMSGAYPLKREGLLQPNTIQAEEQFFKSLEELQSAEDPLDKEILSLFLTAHVAGQSVWQYVQKLPHHFDSGGLFYLQMERDVGLLNGKHCRLPMFPDKIFCYNASQDRLELCLEPHGHFPVGEGIEDKILSIKATDGTMENSRCQSFSNSISQISGSVRKQALPIPFQGTGYSLKDAKTTAKTMERSSENVIVSDIELNQQHASPPHRLVRKGPGFSVLSSNHPKTKSSNLERLQNLADQVSTENQMEAEGHKTSFSSPKETVSADLGFNDITMADDSKFKEPPKIGTESESTPKVKSESDIKCSTSNSLEEMEEVMSVGDIPLKVVSDDGKCMQDSISNCEMEVLNKDRTDVSDEFSPLSKTSIETKYAEKLEEVQKMDTDSV